MSGRRIPLSKRMIAVFALFCVLMSFLNVRVATLATSDDLKETALNQHSYTLTAGSARGQIYDRNFNSLVNTDLKTVSAVLPQPETAADLLNSVSGEDHDTLYKSLQQGRPFLTELLPEELEADGEGGLEDGSRILGAAFFREYHGGLVSAAAPDLGRPDSISVCGISEGLSAQLLFERRADTSVWNQCRGSGGVLPGDAANDPFSQGDHAEIRDVPL